MNKRKTPLPKEVGVNEQVSPISLPFEVIHHLKRAPSLLWGQMFWPLSIQATLLLLGHLSTQYFQYVDGFRVSVRHYFYKFSKN